MSGLSDTRDNLDDIDARVTALEGDIGACACLSAKQLDDWATWRSDWRRKKTDLDDQIDGVENALNAATIGGVLVAGAAESAAAYRFNQIDAEAARWSSELGVWQQTVAAKGGTLSGPAAPSGSSLVPWTTITAVGLGALLVLGVGVWAVTRKAPRVQVAKNPRRRRPRRRRA